MAKILITGNGFDLFHHLPTKYGHFMSIMKTIEKTQCDKEISFDELFGNVFKERFINDYELIIDNYKVENIKFSSQKIKELKELINNNNWYNYFKPILELETWIDFETEFEKVLNDISTIFNDLRINHVKFHYYNKEALNIYTDLKILGFIDNDESYDVVIRKEYLDFNKKKVNEKAIHNGLAISLEQFIVIFNRYLIDIVGVFYKEIKQKKLIQFNLINEIYTFNYTPTIEKIYNVEKSRIVFLHGEIGNDKNQNLVLGINEIPQGFKIGKMYDFAKYYQKVNKNCNKKFIEIPKQETSKLDETIFYIIGHSLDESDKEYICDLFKFLDFDLTLKSKIIVFYYNTQDKEHKLKNLLNIINTNLIVNMNKENRLCFVELNNENINRELNREIFISGDSVFCL
ncbi:AbiH family protein [Flavobacterium sp. LB1P62]|uniref:AbiH family protein n=1 Tax=unclassified Flavobacterium TaxID=196869 RepID=UPI003AAB2CD5